MAEAKEAERRAAEEELWKRAEEVHKHKVEHQEHEEEACVEHKRQAREEEAAKQATEEWQREEMCVEVAQRWVVMEVPPLVAVELQELSRTPEVDRDPGASVTLRATLYQNSNPYSPLSMFVSISKTLA